MTVTGPHRGDRPLFVDEAYGAAPQPASASGG